ncbi:MAG: tRNA pseudouridine(55) synthase TruB [Spirochaetae bacterium HGW-Spirochaetae-9]|nr:MAG: tRNA pseudouridine(55) synthase TruB [Spirochaetae bacterium HGW-Spirochaetae-9]
MTASGFLLFDKPAGSTSFAALGGFRKAYPGARVGHTGTLDSFATGLLVVVVGGYSHLTPWFTGLDKVYEAEITFGIETDTLDPSGTITARGAIPSRESLESALGAFRGSMEQVPPVYSAIHVKGKRASDLARKGQAVTMEPRRITVYSLDLVKFQDAKASIMVHCSSGSYIRSLARDIAAACGTCAHLSALRRTKVGSFAVEDALLSSEGATNVDLKKLDEIIASHLGMNSISVPVDLEKGFSNGAPSALKVLAPRLPCEGETAVFSSRGEFMGIISNGKASATYKMVMPKAEEIL